MVRFAWVLSMGVGFLSLSQEILWVRLVSFTLKGLSQSFAAVLFCFLIGIAVGSAVGKRFCERSGDLLRISAIVLAAAAAVDLSLILLVPALVHWKIGLAGVLALVVLTAGIKSVMFPIAHHLGSQQSGSRIGRSVSKVYFGNIVGSTLGPIVMGYVLLDNLTVDACLLLVGMATGALSLACALRGRAFPAALASVVVVVAAAGLAWYESTGMVRAIALATDRSIDPTQAPGLTINHIVQNRQGIVHTVHTTDGMPDATLGGNIYDGRIAVDMAQNANWLDRALVLVATHPNPERVLVIGLSTGAWARILSASPRVKAMTVVEINPGYLEIIRQYPQVAGVLSDPRIHIEIDDGRRWMRRHPTEQFDLIVQNTTYYWRAYSSNLLSRDYMVQLSSHLKPGGIVALNSTGSSDVLRTAEQVFAHVERRKSFVYGSHGDFARPIASADAALRELQLGSTPVFSDAAFQAGGIAHEMLHEPFVAPGQRYLGMSEQPDVITDQNLLVEHAHGRLRDNFPGIYRRFDGWRRGGTGS